MTLTKSWILKQYPAERFDDYIGHWTVYKRGSALQFTCLRGVLNERNLRDTGEILSRLTFAFQVFCFGVCQCNLMSNLLFMNSKM